MQIAVDGRFLESGKMPEARDFTKEVFGRLAREHPDHHFIIFIDTALNEPDHFPSNVVIKKMSPKPTNFFLFKWWYDVRVALALASYRADVFVGTYGFCSLTTSLPQVLIVRELAFFRKPAFFELKSYKFYRRFTGSSIKKAKGILTLSDFVREEVAARYSIHKSDLKAIGSGVSSFYRPVDWEEREAVKNKYAEGCEYFVFTGSLHPRGNFLNTLKAFSIFKKWQKTNMKLVITGKYDAAFEKDLEKLSTYKYRKDVFIKNGLTDTEMASVAAGAYAVIFPSFYEGFAQPVLAAMYCEVPVITSENSSMSEVAGDAALYVNPEMPASIAEQMKLIFKDEHLRSKLAAAAKQRAAIFSWDKTAALLWHTIEETLSR